MDAEVRAAWARYVELHNAARYSRKRAERLRRSWRWYFSRMLPADAQWKAYQEADAKATELRMQADAAYETWLGVKRHTEWLAANAAK